MRTQITLVGYLGADPKISDVGENNVTNFSVAANRKAKGEELTDWFNVAAWGKLGEVCGKYLEKGRQVVVVGSLEPREYEKDGEKRMSLDITAREVHFVSGGDSPPRDDAYDEQTAKVQRAEKHARDERDEAAGKDDIPF